MNCALLNCNRLYAADGGLRPSFYSFVDCLVALDVRLALLTETWLPTGASLPSDQPFQLIAQPARTPTAAPRGRDTAILHSSEVLATPLGASRSASGFADLTACIVNNLDSSTPTLFISAYAPDASRGLQARADFWSRLDNTLHECHRCHPSADVVLGMDANTWLAVSAGVTTCEVKVHGPLCHPSCRGSPNCRPANGSDHSLITFRIQKSAAFLRPPPSERIVTMDWTSALQGDSLGLRRWHSLVSQWNASRTAPPQAALDSIQKNLTDWLWSLAISNGAIRNAAAGRRSQRHRHWWNPECQQAWAARQAAHRVW